MTQQKPPSEPRQHPCRCETCKTKPCPALEVIKRKPYCDNFGSNWWWDKAGLVTSIVGCASHSANTGAQARIDAVVKELEEIDRLVPAGPYCVGSESLVYIHVTSCQKIHTAIALLKEGVGK